MLNPREFFDEYVMPCVTDWELDPLNIRNAVIAISQIDILADQHISNEKTDRRVLGGVDLGCLCFAHFQTAGTDNAWQRRSSLARFGEAVLETQLKFKGR